MTSATPSWITLKSGAGWKSTRWVGRGKPKRNCPGSWSKWDACALGRSDRNDLGDGKLEHIEERGRMKIDSLGGARQAKKELPWLVVQMGRLRFGTIGPSTHFLELQEVEEILDPVMADHLGIHAGQVTLQFHNGGGVLTGQIGAMYAKRKSASRMLRAEMSVQKPLSHLLAPRSGLRQRLAAYFTEGCPAVPVDGDDGRRVLLATRLAMNYGFAYRMATY